MLQATGLECVRGDRSLFRDVSFTLAAGTLMHVRGVPYTSVITANLVSDLPS